MQKTAPQPESKAEVEAPETLAGLWAIYNSFKSSPTECKIMKKLPYSLPYWHGHEILTCCFNTPNLQLEES